MTGEKHPEPPAPKSDKPTADKTATAADATTTANQLSPEEQMARFEEDLKEHDWGHQPC